MCEVRDDKGHEQKSTQQYPPSSTPHDQPYHTPTGHALLTQVLGAVRAVPQAVRSGPRLDRAAGLHCNRGLARHRSGARGGASGGQHLRVVFVVVTDEATAGCVGTARVARSLIAWGGIE
jgi:hypothetical protein